MIKIYDNKQNISIYSLFLGLYLLLTPLDPIPILSGISVTKVLSLVCLISYFLELKKFKIIISSKIILPIIYLFIHILSSLYSVNQGLSISRSTTIFLLVFLMISVTMVPYNDRELEYINKMAGSSGWIIIILLLFSDNSQRMTFEINGVSQDPNILCGFLIISVMYYFDKFVKTKSYKYILSLIILISCIIFTGSRGGLIALTSSILFYLLVNQNSENIIKKILTIVICIIIIIMIYIIAINILPENISTRFSLKYTIADGGAGRFNYWKRAIDIYKESSLFNQVFGYGAATIKHVTGFVAHNLWIEILLDLGLLGVIVTVIFYLNYIKLSLKEKNTYYASVFIGYIIMSIALSLTTFKPQWNLMMLIFLNSKKRLR